MQDLTPDPTTVEIYKGIDCCDEVQTELQSILQDVASLQGQCDSLRNLMTQQHAAIEQKFQNLSQEIKILQTKVAATLTRIARLQSNFKAWMNWIARALNQINDCTCGKTQPLPPETRQ
ncbi:MAG: hypothetical protein GXO48_07890 [Chlorobi bacterium]|nr:hypothetical protein [Chlorobiota bacterium]